MNYYGTELDSPGHYFWTLAGNDMYRGRNTMSFDKCPFNPEGLPHKQDGGCFQNGYACFYQFAGFSIYAIEGSCADSRSASRSIFFVEKDVNKDQLKALILATPIASKIIKKNAF